MGLALDYASDSDDGGDGGSPRQVEPEKPALPAATASALGLPPPKNRKRPFKIGFDHPLLSVPSLGAAPADDADDRPAKKPRVEKDDAPDAGDRRGKGKSSLLDMLPPPKRALPVTTPAAVETASQNPEDETRDEPLVPRKIAKQAAGKLKPEPAPLDLFGLASTPAPTPIPLSNPSSSTQTLTSAPTIEEYVPPPPTTQDPFPGYYLHPPSGSYLPYPEATYAAFLASIATPAEQPVGRAWEGVQDAPGVEIDVRSRMEAERKQREDLKRMTAPHLSSEENTYKPVSMGRAGQRHQLSALLKDAQMNRAALEERFARDKRTKKESGGKYGF